MKIALCLPIHSTAKGGFVQCLSRMLDFTLRAKFLDPAGEPLPIETETFVLGSSVISHTRNALAGVSLEWGADWLLWLDSDQTFPPNTLARLLSRQVQIIGCNYRRRAPDRRLSTTSALDGAPVFPDGDGIEEVSHMGLGVCLTSADVFRKVPKPYFRFDEGTNGGVVGEDVYFFRKARDAGFIPYVDHALSREVGHIADIELML